ncbi:MAG: PD-(D/E)XK nuclease family protein, partial [Burkholderiaceae bacterium]|nr:PD-(D/E)XK nuclease family protein [Burkholderiaceae bacterium]
ARGRGGGLAGMAPGEARVPRTALQAKLLEQQALAEALQRIADEPWHRFPRGSVPGNFLHEQLEWMAHEGFARVDEDQFDARLLRRIERAGWANRQDDALAWLRAVASTPLPPLGAPLSALRGALPELEFWFPSERLSSGALDRLCRRHILPGVARPALPERRLHGMLKGFMDLMFEHEGRYWVLDYKSNALGGNDSAYHASALALGVAEHRYDIQGALYMLALHRLLRSRLGADYDPATQLGGAVFFFLRGIGHAQTRGCCVLAPDPGLLDGLDALFNEVG